MKKKKPIVNELNFRFFSSADYRDALDRCAAAVERKKCTAKKGIVSAFAYFNDDEDAYKVTIVGGYGDVIEKDCYGWDELSQLLHDNQ